MLDDHTARTVAHHYRGDDNSDLFAFSRDGAVPDGPRLLHEIQEEEQGLPPDHAGKWLLSKLARYVIEFDGRGPQLGWTELWDWEVDRVLQGFTS